MLHKKDQTFIPADTVSADPQIQEAYYRQVASFAQTEVEKARKDRFFAWCVAGGAAVVATAACVAVAALTPLKTVQVVAFRVDNASGAVERVFDVRADKTPVAEATKRYFLWQYVRLREGFSWPDAASSYDTVSLMSAPNVQTEYFNETRASNPESQQTRLGKTGVARVSYVSTAFLDQDKPDHKLAQVRFVVQETREGVALPPRRMVATIAFDFAPGKLKPEEIIVNPLGFIVTSYHADPEAAQ